MSKIQKNPVEKETALQSKKGNSLNFKVTPELKNEFKAYAAAHGMSMVELLKEGFALSRERRK